MAVIHTIGHSTRSIEDFCDLLAAHDIRLLIDVRRYPGSRRHPHFNGEALALSLDAGGIAYRHAPDLGGRRGAATPDSPNTGWRNASFRAYADHLGSPEFRGTLDAVIRDSERGAVALMCAEAVPWRCHRQLISDALVARGHTVLHITSGSEPKPHELNEMARCDDEGVVTYPAPEPPQRELFE